jgi:cell division protein FtsB
MIKKHNYHSIYWYVFIIIILIFNRGNRVLVRRLFEQNKLRKSIITTYKKNISLRKNMYFLEKSNYYFERKIRNELNMIAPGEIEYRFYSKK